MLKRVARTLLPSADMTLVPAGGITQLSDKIIGCAIVVHRAMGPGLLEAPYKLALAVELSRAGLAYALDVPLKVTYGDVKLGCGYRMDVVVEATVVLEIKSVAATLPIHRAQLLTYLRLSGYPVGLLLNFNAKLLKEGIARVLNDR